MRKTKFECDGHYIFDIHEGETPSPCEHLPFYKEYEGKKYCVLHFPKQEKLEHFEKALEEKLDRQDYNFRNIWIPDGAYFGRRCFQSQVDFSYAIFIGEANFELCTFEQEAIFNNVTFEADAIFNSANFGHITSFIASKFNASAIFTDTEFGDLKSKCEIIFYEATFSGKANFSGAKFNCSVEFGSAKFNDSVSFEFSFFSSIGDFKDALFKDYVKFSGEYFRFPCEGEEEINKVFKDESSLNLQFAVFEKPEKVLFHTTLLQPHWFVNTDPRKFEFADVEWKNIEKRKDSVISEIEDLTSRRYENLASPYTLFAIACKRLASNSEENNRYDEASSFRYLAMDSQRLENSKGFSPQTLTWWYWLLSGYGEDWKRAFFWLIGILLICSILYATPLSIFKEELSLWNTFGYSLNVFALQRPEPRPTNWFAMLIVGFEAIFAPLQAALLILAIRRKFMR
jgi:hypothetical protein